MSRPIAFALLLVLGCAPLHGRQEPAPVRERPLLRAMSAELARAVEQLKSAGTHPLHFLAYRVYDVDDVSISASLGAVDAEPRGGTRRTLQVELRVGTPAVDNTRKIRDEAAGFSDYDFSDYGPSYMPSEDDEAAIRNALWIATDGKYRHAQKRLTKVLANRKVKVEEEDASDDFSREEPVVHLGPEAPFEIDRAAWTARLRRLSAIYKDFAEIHESSFSFSAVRTRRCLVTSEGTKVQDERVQYRIFTVVETTADDGMKLQLYDGVEAATPAALPDDARLEALARGLAKSLVELRSAPVAEPFAGPCILRARAAGVIFHEIFGHRIEGHRQKDEDEGRTFAKKVGQPVMPDFISVIDDPRREKLGSTPLNGTYQVDDEGVPSSKVVLVDKGVLQGFLMGRSPVKGFPRSNGHGRCSPGRTPVARQGNLVVEASGRVPYAELRERLVAEIKKQGKPYGLIFDDIAGGFTMTQSFMPQSFKLLPLRVWRVWPDGRPDQVLRGVDIVGTPLSSLEKILAAGDDDDVFNGTCGAESGWVPVSASSPSLLLSSIEVERQKKGQDRPPLLKAPLHDPDDPSRKSPPKEERP